MSRRAGPIVMKLLVAAIAVSTMAADPPQPTGAAASRSWDDYRILLDRNIFRRDRRAIRRASTRPRESYTYDSDSTVVLRGIATRDGQFLAFFEDTRAKTVIRARVGDAVGKGTVDGITLDEVAYARAGAVTDVRIGRNLMGTVAPVLVRREPPPRSTGATSRPAASTMGPAGIVVVTTRPAAPGAASNGAPEADNTDILERMRRDAARSRGELEMRR